MYNLNGRLAQMLRPNRGTKGASGDRDRDRAGNQFPLPNPGARDMLDHGSMGGSDAPRSRLLKFPIGNKQDRPRPIVPDGHDSDEESIRTSITVSERTTEGPRSTISFPDDGDFEILRPNLDGPAAAPRAAGLTPFFEGLLRDEKKKAKQPSRPRFEGVTERPVTTVTERQTDNTLNELRELFDAMNGGGGPPDAMSNYLKVLNGNGTTGSTDRGEAEKPVNWQPLHYAAQRGSLTLCRAIVEKGVEIDPRDGSNRTPLHSAAQQGHLAVCQFLLDNGADANAVGDNGVTPLILAGLTGHCEVAELLLAHDANLEAQSDDDSTALHMVIWFAGQSKKDNLMDMIKLLLAKGSNPNAVDNRRRTPLMACALFNMPEVAAILLQYNADINRVSNDGKTALHYAATECDPAMVKLLLDHKANPALKELKQWNALHLTTQHDREGTLECTKLLLATNAIDPNDQQENGATALYLAVQEGRVDVATALLEAGASPDIPTMRDITPLERAIAATNVKMVEALIGHGADMKRVDKRGRGLAHVAAAQEDVSILRLILDAGADVNLPTTDGRGLRPMHLAVQNDNEEIALTLMEYGGEP